MGLAMYDPEICTWQKFHGWSAGCVQSVVLVLAPLTFVLEDCNSFTHGRRAVFNVLLWLQRRA
eukprot:2946702-Pyramimonas_sp.AAC.1